MYASRNTPLQYILMKNIFRPKPLYIEKKPYVMMNNTTPEAKLKQSHFHLLSRTPRSAYNNTDWITGHNFFQNILSVI